MRPSLPLNPSHEYEWVQLLPPDVNYWLLPTTHLATVTPSHLFDKRTGLTRFALPRPLGDQNDSGRPRTRTSRLARNSDSDWHRTALSRRCVPSQRGSLASILVGVNSECLRRGLSGFWSGYGWAPGLDRHAVTVTIPSSHTDRVAPVHESAALWPRFRQPCRPSTALHYAVAVSPSPVPFPINSILPPLLPRLLLGLGHSSTHSASHPVFGADARA
jgi:hypothetical protein